MKTILDTQPDMPLKPEWIRINQTTRIFGIGRTKLYELIAQGKIKTASIKSRGNVRGTRLLSYDSVAAFIDTQIEANDLGKEQA